MLTLSDLLRDEEQYHWDELAAGALVAREPCSAYAGGITEELAYRIMAFVKTHALGIVTHDPAGYILSTDPATVRCPDVGFISTRQLPGGKIPAHGFYRSAPDLAVEILSPTDRTPNVMRKVGEYLAAGTKIVWVIYPKTRSAQVFHANDEAAMIVGPTGSLDGEDVLPGFTLSLSELFDSVPLAEDEE